MHVYVCTYVYVCFYACVNVWVYVCVRVCVCVYVYVCMCTCACMFAYVCGEEERREGCRDAAGSKERGTQRQKQGPRA